MYSLSASFSLLTQLPSVNTGELPEREIWAGASVQVGIALGLVPIVLQAPVTPMVLVKLDARLALVPILVVPSLRYVIPLGRLSTIFRPVDVPSGIAIVSLYLAISPIVILDPVVKGSEVLTRVLIGWKLSTVKLTLLLVL